jgi:hypothetical protein
MEFLQFTHTYALSRFSKMLPPATTHTSAWPLTTQVASCNFSRLLLFQLVQGHNVRLQSAVHRRTVMTKHAFNSVTTENWTRINFFDHKDLGNLLLQ